MTFRSAFEVVSGILLAVTAVVAAVEETVKGSGKGTEKKSEALARLSGIISLQVPAIVRPMLPMLLGFLIDAAVAFANQNGFFQPSAAS